jgi:hypothetical protein
MLLEHDGWIGHATTMRKEKVTKGTALELGRGQNVVVLQSTS